MAESSAPTAVTVVTLRDPAHVPSGGPCAHGVVPRYGRITVVQTGSDCYCPTGVIHELGTLELEDSSQRGTVGPDQYTPPLLLHIREKIFARLAN